MARLRRLDSTPPKGAANADMGTGSNKRQVAELKGQGLAHAEARACEQLDEGPQRRVGEAEHPARYEARRDSQSHRRTSVVADAALSQADHG
jgi:hypothetical protein